MMIICRLIIICNFFIIAFAHAEGITVEPPKPFFKDCEACPEVQLIPKGTFKMGARDYDKEAIFSEKPQKSITIDHHFYMGRYEVTIVEYGVCVDEGVCRAREKSDSELWQPYFYSHTPGDPIEGITWEDAKTYVTWLSKRTGKSYRLPTEAEWEYAARGGTETIYWWGDEVTVNHANCKECTNRNIDSTTPAGIFPPNPFDLYDMTGNVAEWVEDCWRKDLSNASQEAASGSEEECTRRVVKGGSYAQEHRRARISSRGAMKSSTKVPFIGFRVVRDID